MTEDARRLGADAIVAVRVQTTTVQIVASEVIWYGTAVRLGQKSMT
ncbi:heavy metal-binding domain-containing protein [Tropicimonas sp. IMCC34043]